MNQEKTALDAQEVQQFIRHADKASVEQIKAMLAALQGELKKRQLQGATCDDCIH